MSNLTATYTCRFCRLTSDGSAGSCPHCGAPIDVRARQRLGVDGAAGHQGHGPDPVRPVDLPDRGHVRAHRRLRAGRRRLDLLLPPRPVVGRALGPHAGHVDGGRLEPGDGRAPPGDDAGCGPGDQDLATSPSPTTTPARSSPCPSSTARPWSCASTGSWPPPAAWATTGTNRASGSRPRAATTPNGTTPSAATWTPSRPSGGPGLLLLHSPGNTFIRDLAPGQTILIQPSALLYKDPSVQMHLHFEYPAARGCRGAGPTPTARCGCAWSGPAGWRCSRCSSGRSARRPSVATPEELRTSGDERAELDIGRAGEY